ncbi:MAG: hypothetical protein A2W05_02815 [Candidatus Schekmanbacteria bacterium RBG_16_38_10]|uniref:Uncharacterized protein n=1 Tax=Candidatus Schekmanbacteria bacterium RBG_16_38_10 TaxID=1817879 RepID=A0A1F7S297_9BACT|nr:MAG: hypothetical protein A2W05_02815 [Candidatus Schekmanbacteria bacterium RBG_16_38_10]
MRASKEFGICILCLFFFSLILDYFELLMISEKNIFRLQSYFFAFWTPFKNFFLEYPLDIAILLSITLITFYILRFLGIRIQ